MERSRKEVRASRTPPITHMLYAYVKAPPGYVLKHPKTFRERLRISISLTTLTLGVAALTTAIYPIVSFGFIYAPKFRTIPQVAAALPFNEVSSNSPTFIPELINTNLDYTSADNWFANDQSYSLTSNNPKEEINYTLSIPDLGIVDAIVKYGEDDLKKSLVQYPGTAMPGDLGNPVVLGHSTLPQFFSPTNYKTIFSTLHTLELGNQILVSYDGVDYQYQITSMYEVEPENLSPLAQRYDRRILTLITCTPPGTYLRRLIVIAELA